MYFVVQLITVKAVLTCTRPAPLTRCYRCFTACWVFSQGRLYLITSSPRSLSEQPTRLTLEYNYHNDHSVMTAMNLPEARHLS